MSQEEGKAPITISYFAIKGRTLFWLIAKYGQLSVQYDPVDSDNWKDIKAKTTFGQLPIMEDHSNGIKVAQSAVIERYLARKAGLVPDEEKEFLLTEQLHEQSRDILLTLGLAKINNAFDGLEERVAPKLRPLEGLIQENSSIFSTGGGIMLGDLAIFHVLNLLMDNDENALQSFPQLQRFYEHMLVIDEVQEYLQSSYPPYLVRAQEE